MGRMAFEDKFMDLVRGGLESEFEDAEKMKAVRRVVGMGG